MADDTTANALEMTTVQQRNDEAMSVEEGNAASEADNHHSLPNPEEIKTDRTGPAPPPKSCLSSFFLIMFVLVIVGIVAGLSVGLKDDDNDKSVGNGSSDDGYTPLPGGDNISRRDLIVKFLTDEQISNPDLFTVSTSPQNKAVRFLATSDQLQLAIPTLPADKYRFIIRYVMTLFYYATDGPNWRFQALFLTSHDTCDWYQPQEGSPLRRLGVICNDFTREFLGFDFAFNNLVGTLPGELGHLTTMVYMSSIGHLQLKGAAFPSKFSALTNLETILLPHNALTGKLPTYLGTFTNLKSLYLSNNNLNGVIPSTLDGCAELRDLAIDDNDLEGQADTLWSFPKLQYLYAAGNAISGFLPSSFLTTSPDLMEVDLSGNIISGSLPNDIFTLSTLKVFDVNGNLISGDIPSNVQNITTNLEFLSLQDNMFIGSIPSELGMLHGIQHFDCSTNDLQGFIPNELDQWSNTVTYLFLAENPFVAGEIPTFLFRLTKLQELNLKSTGRVGPIPEVMGLLTKLLLLDLDNNSLSGTIPNIISSLNDLQFLILSRNNLVGPLPPDLGNLINLSVFLLDRNDINGTLDDSICDDTIFPDIELAIADCQEEITCSCCDPCCKDGQDCHQNYLVVDIDFNWEASNQRQYYIFAQDGSATFDANDLGIP